MSRWHVRPVPALRALALLPDTTARAAFVAQVWGYPPVATTWSRRHAIRICARYNEQPGGLLTYRVRDTENEEWL